MSTETVNQQIPAGTWTVDPVHSTIHFAVTHSEVATFRSGFKEYEATLTGGEAPQLDGLRRGRQHRHRGGAAQGPPPQPRVLRRGASIRGWCSARPSSASTTTARSGSPASSRSAAQTHEVNAVGRFASVPAYLDGRERIGLSVETGVDRREFGLDWNADLPNGGQALEYEVAINVELEFVTAEAE